MGFELVEAGRIAGNVIFPFGISRHLISNQFLKLVTLLFRFAKIESMYYQACKPHSGTGVSCKLRSLGKKLWQGQAAEWSGAAQQAGQFLTHPCAPGLGARTAVCKYCLCPSVSPHGLGGW